MFPGGIVSRENSYIVTDLWAEISSRSAPGSSTGTTDSDRLVILVVAVVAVVVAGVFVVTVLSGAGLAASSSSVDGTVAVVSIKGPIVQPIGEQPADELADIRLNASIDAVVLEMNTPGSAPAPTERMYFSIQRTSEEMPLLAKQTDETAEDVVTVDVAPNGETVSEPAQDEGMAGVIIVGDPQPE